MERYERYKDSGVKWIGEIPGHWGMYKLKYLFKLNKNKNIGNKCNTILSLSYGKIKIKKDLNEGLTPESYESYQLLSTGDIVIRSTDLQNDHTSLRTGLVKIEGAITSAYIGLKNLDMSLCDSRFYHYFLHDWDITKAIYNQGKGLRQSLNWDDIKNMLIPVLDISEQTAIANYLDSTTAKIDEAIVQQQKMIDLLNERKQIIINNAVTKGLNPDAPMKDSGVEWIGKICKNWRMYRLKHLLKTNLMYGANESAESEETSYPRYIRITDIDENGKLKPDTFRSLEPLKAEPYLLTRGDILFARSGATAGKTYLFDEDIKACFAGYLIKAQVSNKLLSRYLMYYTRSGIYDQWKNSIFIQATIQNIGADKYANLRIPLPTIEEQKKIVSYLDTETMKIDKVLDTHKRQISLLQERKQIIINDVVTGKVKVS